MFWIKASYQGNLLQVAHLVEDVGGHNTHANPDPPGGP
jgi:hypothetical protein